MPIALYAPAPVSYTHLDVYKRQIMAYGQDDRVCAFTSLKAMLDVTAVEKTACCILVDKEEIGSTGATGMNSKFFENAAAELLDRMGQYSDLRLRRMLANSNMPVSYTHLDVYKRQSWNWSAFRAPEKMNIPISFPAV